MTVTASALSSCARRFAEQVARAPERTALIVDDRHMTYEQLAGRAGRVAEVLRARGVGAGDHVGLGVGRGADAVAALLGILAVGAAYVPLDAAYPIARRRFMATDANCAVVFVDDPGHGGCFDLPALNVPSGIAPYRADPVGTDDLAYVIYTSGSTGRPKGVLARHGGVAALLQWSDRTFSDEEVACLFASTSLSFDVSVFEVFAPLVRGGAVLLARDVRQLADHPQRARATLISTVPSAMSQLLRVTAVPDRVRTVCLAGEAFPADLARRLVRPGLRVVNAYGPTEDTVFSTWHQVDTVDGPPPIGTPITGTSAYVLGADGAPAAEGEPGELHLAGAGLARGYQGLPELTAAAFVPDHVAGHGRMYRTGDIASWRSGVLHYHGRHDEQVKLRGHRIELGEVSHALRALPAVSDAVAAVETAPSGAPALVAWVCPATVDGAALQAGLAASLPHWMVPSAVVPLARMPRLPNGKLDRAALPAPSWGHGHTGQEPHVECVRAAFGDALTRVLGVPLAGAAESSFHDLGGDSLTAMRLSAEVEAATGVRLGIDTILRARCVAELARSAAKRAGAGPAPRARAADRSVPSPAQQQMWVMQQLRPGRKDYWTAAVLELSGPSTQQDLVAALSVLVRRHPDLHCTMASDSRVIEHPDRPPPLDVISVGAGIDPDAAVEHRLAALADTAPDLRAELPLRVVVAPRGGNGWIVGLLVHHSAFDGASLGVVLRDLTQILAARLAAAPAPAPLDYDTRDHAAWLARPAVRARLADERAWLATQLHGAPALLDWPAIPARAEVTASGDGRVVRELPGDLAAAAAATAAALGTTAFVVELLVMAEVVGRHLGVDELLIGTAASTRRHPSLRHAVGCLTNLVPLRIHRRASLSASARRNGGLVHETLERAEVPFPELVTALTPPRAPGRNPLVQVTFGIDADPVPSAEAGPVRGSGRELHLSGGRLDLAVWQLGTTELAWTWKAGLLDEPTVHTLHDRFVGLLRRSCTSPHEPFQSRRRFAQAGARRRVDAAAARAEPIAGGIVWCLRSSGPGQPLLEYVRHEHDQLLARLREHGAVLLRGFAADAGDATLAAVVDALFTTRITYGERSSPRTEVSSGVYTSTDHPADQPIVLHNEQSYTLNWPLRILFQCQVPAAEGGATPLADAAAILSALDRSAAEAFATRGVRYVRNYLPGFGLSWQEAFQTSDRGAVEAYCAAQRIDTEWVSTDHLRTTQVRPAVRRHPETGALVFFNHGLFFHVTSLPPQVAADLVAAVSPEDYPTNTAWGDGEPFDPDLIDHLRGVVGTHTRRFQWRSHDVLIVDNMRLSHGRDPFRGPRRVLAAMADPIAALHGPPTAVPGAAP